MDGSKKQQVRVSGKRREGGWGKQQPLVGLGYRSRGKKQGKKQQPPVRLGYRCREKKQEPPLALGYRSREKKQQPPIKLGYRSREKNTNHRSG